MAAVYTNAAPEVGVVTGDPNDALKGGSGTSRAVARLSRARHRR